MNWKVWVCYFQKVFRFARLDAKKALFLITDGYSNGGDPRPAAEALKRQGVEIFTFGIRQGNFVELCEMASEKKEEHTYILNTFEEFEVLARRALHEGLSLHSFTLTYTRSETPSETIQTHTDSTKHACNSSYVHQS